MTLSAQVPGSDDPPLRTLGPFPKARQGDDIVAQEVLDEFVVYDLPRNKVHALNPTAAMVYRWCDGQTSPQVMAQRLAEQNNLSAQQGQALAGLALRQLQQVGLVEWIGSTSAAMSSVTRRKVLARVGAAALVPVVYSLVAPTAAQAQSASGCLKKGTNPCGDYALVPGTCYPNAACNPNSFATTGCTACYASSGGNNRSYTYP